MLLWSASVATPQDVRRARPVDEPPAPRAAPAEQPADKTLRSLVQEFSETPASETERSDQRQLDYANALFTRKLYDLAIPEYQKYLDEYPGRPGRANAYFSLGECYRNLNRVSSARTNLQKVLNDYGDSEFAAPAAYALAEIAFADKDYSTALPLFHRAAGRSKEPAVALSARYFEARCLEALGRKDEAANIYAEVAEAGNPNPYREDARVTAASIFAARGRKAEALKQFEALANEAQKPALKAESAVRGGMIALELIQVDKGKLDKSMVDRATALLQKGRTMPEAGKFRAIAQVGLRRLQYQTGQYAQLLADYKKELEKLPEAAQAEVLLLAANSCVSPVSSCLAWHCNPNTSAPTSSTTRHWAKPQLSSGFPAIRSTICFAVMVYSAPKFRTVAVAIRLPKILRITSILLFASAKTRG